MPSPASTMVLKYVNYYSQIHCTSLIYETISVVYLKYDLYYLIHSPNLVFIRRICCLIQFDIFFSCQRIYRRIFLNRFIVVFMLLILFPSCQDLNSAHQSFARLHSGFFGMTHMLSIARLLGSRSLPWLIRALLDHISNKVQYGLDISIHEIHLLKFLQFQKTILYNTCIDRQRYMHTHAYAHSLHIVC